MATISITKVSVNKPQEGMFYITLNLKVIESGKEIINRDFTEKYKIDNTISHTIERFREKMQKCIDDYKAEQQVYNSSQLASSIITLQGQLVY